MAWDEEMNIMTRVWVNDAAASKYTDDRLNQAILMSMMVVQMELDFDNTYEVNIVQETVDPDPTVDPYRDTDFMTLVTIKTACTIDRGSASDAAGQALRVKDGQSEVDLRDRFKAQLELLKTGWCSVYDKLKDQFILGQRGSMLGAAVLSPFRLFAGYGNDQPFGTTGMWRWGSR